MKFVLTSWGSRGEVEPCAAVGRELVLRGHEVRMAVPPDLVGFVESAGLDAVAHGPSLQSILDAYRDFWTCLFRRPWRVRDLVRLWRAISEPINQWQEMSATVTSLSDGADLLLTSNLGFEQLAANVAEHYDIPLVTLHWFPMRANGQLVPSVPAPLCRSAMTAHEWLSRGGAAKKNEEAQRRALGLPKATGPWPRRIAERASLEIQAYDEVCFPGLAAEWAKFGAQRPFVGALTMGLPTDADDEVASWIAAGTPPIFFGFGSMPVDSAVDTLAMISEVSALLGERALICAGETDFSHGYQSDHVKIVKAVNFATVFPVCRAVVHHGGAGTTAIGLRAGIPALVLSTDANQALWGTTVKRLKVGTARRFSTSNQETLVKDLRTILTPSYLTAARELADRMTKPAESIAAAADLVEHRAHFGRVG
ncbi:glycosyltransferase [Mycolicibacterium celeriflavum]|uniref:glycosyltransferase n=1 Tax=Mycolicibacterium celeriflavum TaxID=1249101 RepID=UPI003CEB032C